MATEFLPGWYTDPSDSTRVRYWSGALWTKDTWNLADVEHFVSRGPSPPVSIDFDDGSSWGQAGFDDDAAHIRAHGWGRRLLSYCLIGMMLLAVAGAAAWIAWNQLQP